MTKHFPRADDVQLKIMYATLITDKLIELTLIISSAIHKLIHSVLFLFSRNCKLSNDTLSFQLCQLFQDIQSVPFYINMFLLLKVKWRIMKELMCSILQHNNQLSVTKFAIVHTWSWLGQWRPVLVPYVDTAKYRHRIEWNSVYVNRPALTERRRLGRTTLDLRRSRDESCPLNSITRVNASFTLRACSRAHTSRCATGLAVTMNDTPAAAAAAPGCWSLFRHACQCENASVLRRRHNERYLKRPLTNWRMQPHPLT